MLFIKKRNLSMLISGFTVFTLFLLWHVLLTGYDLISQKYDHIVIKKFETDTPKVAITFDDGPHPLTTMQILAILRQKKVKATFFVLGENAEAYPKIVKQIHDEGHELSNHGYSHTFFSTLSEAKYKKEILNTENIVSNIIGTKPVLLRPPGGHYNNRSLAVAEEMGYLMVLWSIDTRDWANVSVSNMLHTIEKARPGDIILLHDTRARNHTIEALPFIIDMLQSKGYQLVTLSDLIFNTDKSTPQQDVTLQN